ncbi:MAG: nuclear transport factor 2 family protein [Asticcacaulis sp.]|uniref:nuclear transport factor 2 family protein n=1 Tax=Asticcacaulis sp. TaxID=1872648 RepID=UPI0039E5AC0F
MSLEAEAIVRKQLDAYNAKDIETFMSCWAEDAEVFAHPDIPLASGHTEIRERHVVRFQERDLQARLLSRTVMGNRVIDTELVTRNFPEGVGQVDVVGIYEVEDGLILRAWFMMGAPRLRPNS